MYWRRWAQRSPRPRPYGSAWRDAPQSREYAGRAAGVCLDKCSRYVPYAGGPPSWPLMPIFTPHQDAALTAASIWLKAARGRASIFRLFGYAGTGKPTLAKHLAEGVDGKVLFAAFTAKAARSEEAPTIRALLAFQQAKIDPWLHRDIQVIAA